MHWLRAQLTPDGNISSWDSPGSLLCHGFKELSWGHWLDLSQKNSSEAFSSAGAHLMDGCVHTATRAWKANWDVC